MFVRVPIFCSSLFCRFVLFVFSQLFFLLPTERPTVPPPAPGRLQVQACYRTGHHVIDERAVRVPCVLEYHHRPRQATCISFMIEAIASSGLWPPLICITVITHTLQHSVFIVSLRRPGPSNPMALLSQHTQASFEFIGKTDTCNPVVPPILLCVRLSHLLAVSAGTSS